MERKKNRVELLFIIGFLFTLIIAFGTFFLGLRIGMDKTEAKYAYLKAVPPEDETSVSYQQQDLVTFYYIVFQPYQQFKEDYLAYVDDISRNKSHSEINDKLREIRQTADKQYEQIAAHSISDSSPLLKEAQTDFLKSLKLFKDSIGQVKSGDLNGSTVADMLASDTFTKNAKLFGLQAQKKYYSSILKWTAKTNSNVPSNISYRNDITIKEWSKFSLSVKNKMVTDIMTNDKLFVSYLPQDLTAKIDQMIQSGKAKSLKLDSVSAIVKVLTETEAVKGKEFSKWKSAYYSSESLPELPFFTED